MRFAVLALVFLAAFSISAEEAYNKLIKEREVPVIEVIVDRILDEMRLPAVDEDTNGGHTYLTIRTAVGCTAGWLGLAN